MAGLLVVLEGKDTPPVPVMVVTYNTYMHTVYDTTTIAYIEN